MKPWLSSKGLEISVPTEGDASDWLYVDWKGWHTAESVQEGCEAMLACLRTSGLTKVLNDNSHGVGDWYGAADWTARDWFPRMEAAGLRHFAWVESASRVSRRSADRTVAEARLDQIIHRFTDRRSAEEWLAQQ
jgi:hypothetical protein